MQFIPDNNREGDRIAYIVNKKIKQQKLYRIYICPPWYNLTFYYHFDKKLFKNTDAIGQLKETEHIKPVYSFDDINISEETQQVIFVDAYSNFLFSNNNIKSGFNDNFVLKDSIHFKGDYIVYEFIKNDN
ncbi:MAG TPA: hypothetical protein EYG85_04195 [Crocinitomix sp.]|nr:hypothetical protein [Crocinitomix sp.]